MDDIDALEIDEDEYSMHSLSSKRNKISTPATLVPEGWPTLHNASGMLGPARSTQSPMTGICVQRFLVDPQQGPQIHVQRRLSSPPRQLLADNTGTPRSQRKFSLTSPAHPSVRAKWGRVSIQAESLLCAFHELLPFTTGPHLYTLISLQWHCAGVQHPSLPGPAGDLKMTDGESSLAQPKAMRSLPLPPELLTIGRDVFSSIRWQSALEAAGVNALR